MNSRTMFAKVFGIGTNIAFLSIVIFSPVCAALDSDMSFSTAFLIMAEIITPVQYLRFLIVFSMCNLVYSFIIGGKPNNKGD